MPWSLRGKGTVRVVGLGTGKEVNRPDIADKAVDAFSDAVDAANKPHLKIVRDDEED